MSGVFRSEAGRALVHADYRATLNAWPVPFQEHRIPTCEGETFVLTCGPVDAPPVVLLHGGGSTSAQWARNAASWSRKHRLIAIDIIGEPGFSAPNRPSFRSDAHARWLDDVWTAFGLCSAVVVATSLGGLLAIDYAVRRSERIGKLALLSPAGIAPVRAKYLFTAVPLYFFGAKGRRKTLERVFGLPPEERTAETEAFMASCERVLEHHRIRTQPLPTFSDDQLRRLTMPLFAIVGRKDIVFSAVIVRRRLAACAPAARVLELPRAGHGLTDPTLLVQEFLQH